MYQTRLATPEDAAIFAQQRYRMSVETGRMDDSDLQRKIKAFERWAAHMIQLEKYIGWLTLNMGQPVAGAGLLILDWPPCALDTEPYRGYLLNIYVDMYHRRKRLASNLIELAIAEARQRNIRVVSLHATETGHALYSSLGFGETNEMLYVDHVSNRAPSDPPS